MFWRVVEKRLWGAWWRMKRIIGRRHGGPGEDFRGTSAKAAGYGPPTDRPGARRSHRPGGSPQRGISSGPPQMEDLPGQPALTPYAWSIASLWIACSRHGTGRRAAGAICAARCRGPSGHPPAWPEALGFRTSPSKAAAREELRRLVRQVMEQLPPRDQEVLTMRHFDQLSFQEAAAVLGVTENAATVRCARALRRFKDLWLQLAGRANRICFSVTRQRVGS